MSRRKLRGMLQTEGLIVAPGAYDPFTARIIEHVGFPAVYLGGHSLGIQLCTGQPFTTMSETVDGALHIMRAVEVPLIVDADAGFGEPAHTHRTVREFERAGVAAIHIDDQPFPKRAGYHRGHGELLPIKEVVNKLGAAVAARRDPEMVLIARTDALRVTGSMRETIKRGHAYAEAGIDMLMVLDLAVEAGAGMVDQFPHVPLVWIGGVDGPGPSLAAIEAAGFKMAVYPFNTAAAVTDAVVATWTRLRQSGHLAQSAELIERSRIQVLELIGMATYWEIEDRTSAPSARPEPSVPGPEAAD